MTPILRLNAENISSHIVYTDTQINDVMVDGEFLMKDKQFCRADTREILYQAQKAANYIIQQIDKTGGK